MRDSTLSIVSNTKTMMVAQVITWASSFVLMMFLPRYLGAEVYGRLYFAMSVTLLGGLLIDLGLSSLFVKEVARDKSKVNLFFMNAAGLKLIAWLLTMAVILIYSLSIQHSPEMLAILVILGFGMLFQTLSDLVHRVFQSFERMHYRSIAVVIERVTLAVVGVVMLLSGYGVVTIALVMTFTLMLNFFSSMYLLPKFVSLKFQFSLSSWMTLIRGALPFLISTVFSFIYFRVDVIMLSAMTSDKVVGWYGAPYKLFDTLMFFPSILQMAVFPVFSRLWKESRDELFQVARKVLNVIVIAGIAVSVLLITQSKHIIEFLFGLNDYGNSVIILQGLALCLPLVYANFVITIVDIASDKQKQLSVISIIAAVINLGLNFWMIPLFQKSYGNGAIGAMISTLITEICVMVMFIYLLPKGCFVKENILVTALSVAAGIIAVTILWLLENIISLWYVSALTGIVIYTAILIITRVLTKHELNIMLGFFSKRRLASSSSLF